MPEICDIEVGVSRTATRIVAHLICGHEVRFVVASHPVPDIQTIIGIEIGDTLDCEQCRPEPVRVH